MSPPGYTHAHPFPSGWKPGRLDMGADGTFVEHMVAPFDCTVEYAGVFNGWDGSDGILLSALANLSLHPRLARGVPTGWIYVVEGIKPVVRVGEVLHAGHIIGAAVRNPYNGIIGNIEWGVASPGRRGVQTNAHARDLGQGPEATKMVLAFSNWFQEDLGVHPPTSTDNAGRP